MEGLCRVFTTAALGVQDEAGETRDTGRLGLAPAVSGAESGARGGSSSQHSIALYIEMEPLRKSVLSISTLMSTGFPAFACCFAVSRVSSIFDEYFNRSPMPP